MVDVKKVKSLTIVLMVGIILVGGCIGTPGKNELKQMFSEFNEKYNETQSQGYNVTEADEFIKEARKAYDTGDYKTANDLLDKASGALDKAKGIQLNKAISNEDAKRKLSQVKVASQYRYVLDGIRSIDDVIKIIKETRTGFKNLGWGRLV